MSPIAHRNIPMELVWMDSRVWTVLVNSYLAPLMFPLERARKALNVKREHVCPDHAVWITFKVLVTKA